MSISDMSKVLERALHYNGEFLINLPYHHRWYLPNKDFAFNGVIFGDDIKCSVLRLSDMWTMQTLTFKLSDPKWQDHVEMFQALAIKKYPRPLRHKRSEAREELFRSRHRDSRW